MRHWFSILLICAGLSAARCPSSTAQESGSQRPQSSRKLLTVQRIYSEPSLSGHLYAGVAWSPDGRWISFLKEGDRTSEEKAILTIDAATGSAKVLVSADKLTALLPPPSGNATQATGLGRRPATLYQWAPQGSALLLQGQTSLSWFDLKTQAGRALVTGKEEIADPKISPDGQYVSFVRRHNLWLVSVANASVHALTNGGKEEIRKG